MSSERAWFDRHPRLGFALVYAALLPILFVGQCLIRGWSHWGDALTSTLLTGVILGGGQFLLIVRPRLRARDDER